MYLILDPMDDGQQFPLARFLAEVAAIGRSPSRPYWEVVSACGYGKDVCDMEDVLEDQASIPDGAEQVLKISSDPNQWFYDLQCVDCDSGLRFGVLDSSGLFIEGSEELCRLVTAKFEDVRRINEK